MKSLLEYPIDVRSPLVHRLADQWFEASIAASAAMLLVAFLVCNASAQTGSPAAHINIAPSTGSVAPRTGSVFQPTGAFGHAALAPYGTSSIHSTPVHHFPIKPPAKPNNGSGYPYSQNGPTVAYYPYFYPVAVPYADDTAGDQTADQAVDAESQDAPTGPGWVSQDPYASPAYNGPMRPYDAQDASFSQTADPAPETPQPPTMLVFKDGHQLEVENYAIVGQTLYDLTPGHARKVALASLDLEATEKQNDDRGVTFQLPPSPLSNN
jgi:hypothetical protein